MPEQRTLFNDSQTYPPVLHTEDSGGDSVVATVSIAGRLIVLVRRYDLTPLFTMARTLAERP